MDYVNLLAILSSNQLDYEKENLQSQKFDLGDCPFKLSYNFLQNTINLGKFVLEIEAVCFLFFVKKVFFLNLDYNYYICVFLSWLLLKRLNSVV